MELQLNGFLVLNLFFFGPTLVVLFVFTKMTHADQFKQSTTCLDRKLGFPKSYFIWFSTVMMLYEDCSRILQLWFSKVMKPHLLFTFQPMRFYLNVLEVLHHKFGIPREHINSESIHVSSNVLIAVIQ